MADAMAGTRVLVVIPCLNEAAHLAHLLAVMSEDAPLATIVVADGGSSDGSQRIVEQVVATNPLVHLLDNPRRLQSAGVNLAVERFGDGHDWLVRVDAHCGYPRGYVAGLLQAAAETSADAVVVPMRTVGRTCFQRAAAAAQNSRLGTGGSPHRHVGRGRWVDHGHHALCSIARYRAVGGYDEGFSHNEDAELDHRLGLAGARIWLEPTLALDYLPRASPRALLRQYRGYGRGRAQTVRRHRMRLKPRQLAPLAVVPAILMLPLALLWWPFAVPFLLWTGLCLAGGLAIGRRQRDLCASAAGVAAIIMHAGWGFGFLRQSLRAASRS